MTPVRPNQCRQCRVPIQDRRTLCYIRDRWICRDCATYWDWWDGLDLVEKLTEYQETYEYLLKYGAAAPSTVEQLWKLPARGGSFFTSPEGGVA